MCYLCLDSKFLLIFCCFFSAHSCSFLLIPIESVDIDLKCAASHFFLCSLHTTRRLEEINRDGGKRWFLISFYALIKCVLCFLITESHESLHSPISCVHHTKMKHYFNQFVSIIRPPESICPYLFRSPSPPSSSCQFRSISYPIRSETGAGRAKKKCTIKRRNKRKTRFWIMLIICSFRDDWRNMLPKSLL